MYYPSSNSSTNANEASVASTRQQNPSLQPYDNYLQHRHARPEHVEAGKEAVEAYTRQLEAAATHKANSSDRLLQSVDEKRAMERAAAVREALRTASEKRANNACAVMEDAARTRARNIDSTQSNEGCADVWDFGCPSDIFQAACDGDVDIINDNLQSAASMVKAAVEAAGLASAEPDEESDAGREEHDNSAKRARAEVIAGSPRLALAANLINALGQPHASRYTGVQFEKRWTFQAPPLVFAVAFNRERAVKALLQWGANPMQASSTGLTALDYAQQRGYDMIAAMLVEAMKHEQADSSTLLELTPVGNAM